MGDPCVCYDSTWYKTAGTGLSTKNCINENGPGIICLGRCCWIVLRLFVVTFAFALTLAGGRCCIIACSGRLAGKGQVASFEGMEFG